MNSYDSIHVKDMQRLFLLFPFIIHLVGVY